MSESKTSHLLVAAFDFGTTYSGYAFSFGNDPLKVHTNQNWIAGSEKLISLKTPTCVLLTPDKKFHSFGFEAENKYANLAEVDEHQGWLLFRRFKMLLHNNEKLSRATTVEDINRKSMTAITLFSMCISYLRDHLLNELNKQTTGVDETDIQYVMTVPAIWDDSAKQFMREAAVQAGLDTQRLKLALEPEAASMWCQNAVTAAKGALSGSGTQYMVVDLGGGTADISVHEKNKDGTLKELHKASGGPWGGMYVDNNYLQFLEQMFGKKAMECLKKEEMADYFDVLREFETKKRSIRSDTKDPITFRISATLKEMSEEKEDTTLEDRLASLNLGEKVVIKRDKMRIDPSIVKTWFDKPLNDVINHVKGILAEPKMNKVRSILLVGGFGESLYVQDTFSKQIKSTRLIVPNEAGLTVLRGAIRFGHEPGLLSTRIMQFTYGVSVHIAFDEKRHPLTKLVEVNGRKYAANCFNKFVSAGDTIDVGYEKKKVYYPTSVLRTSVRIFRSCNPNPLFTTDEGCKCIGELIVAHPEGDALEEKVYELILVFGDTELIVKARILKSGREFYTTVDCLK